jgi:hypothetical protein
MKNQSIPPQNDAPPRSTWGAPEIEVLHEAGQWIIAGKKNRARLDESDLTMTVEAGPVTWRMAPSSPEDMLVQWRGEIFYLRLADAGKIVIEPYDTGCKTGVKIRLERFRSTGLFSRGLELDLAVVLTVCLEGEAEELVCDAVAIERETSVQQLDWPPTMDASDVDFTVLPHERGNLLPRDWPQEYGPFLVAPAHTVHGDEGAGDRTSVIVSNLIECWSMSWWGFQRGESAMMVIVETSADASYQFSHPPGGPTIIGPRWLAALGRLRYPRTVRMCFFPRGNYVTLAKRYRRHVMDAGQFVSLEEKIARTPAVAKLIGAPHVQQFAMVPGRSFEAMPYLLDLPIGRFYQENPDKGYGVVPFDDLAAELRRLKGMGLERLHVTVSGWNQFGINVQHPDPLPPSEPAGGWEGFERWVETCQELGYTRAVHDQYRDYFVDAPSFDPQFALHEEDMFNPPTTFPGTRFIGWKEGHVPYMDEWGGGKQAYLNPRFALGHLIKNHELMARHGVELDGVYFDVLGYCPPTEDFNPEHLTTRAESMAARARLFNWARNNRGVVGVEAGADWVIPYVDYACQAREGVCISVPLYNLVYHDAIMTPAGGLRTPLRCLLNGGFPWYVTEASDMEMVQAICALHERVATLEMVNHEFLDDTYRKERTTFADGVTVTIDRDTGAYEIDPPLQ